MFEHDKEENMNRSESSSREESFSGSENSGREENLVRNENSGREENLVRSENSSREESFSRNENSRQEAESQYGQGSYYQGSYRQEDNYYTGGQHGRQENMDHSSRWQTACTGVQPDNRSRDYHQSSFYPNGSCVSIPEKKRKGKSGKIAKRIAGITAAALLFGVVSGGTMYGVNRLGRQFDNTEEPAAVQEQTTIQKAPLTDNTLPSGSSGADVTPAILLDVSDIVEKAMPSVVAINNTMVYERSYFFGPNQKYEVPSSGSGIIIGQNDTELLIVTNNHVVQDSKEMQVVFIDNTSVSAAIKGTDASSDLAVIAVPLDQIPEETKNSISIAVTGDSSTLKVGQGVVAIGNALGYGQSVTVGYISALEREVKAEDNASRFLLQTDAAINPGNSGGALLNMNGELIGINAAKYSSTDVEGMGYAIPITEAEDIINELMNKKTRTEIEESKKGYLGIQGVDIDQTASMMYDMPRGVYVYKITEDSAAAASDLQEKDIITKFDGQSIRNMTELQEMLGYYEGGTTVKLTVQSLTDGAYQEREVEVTLGYRPKENQVQ